MHRPPATRFSVLRSSRFGRVLVCLGLLSCGAAVGAAFAGFSEPRLAAVALSGLLSVAILWIFWRKQPVGHLRWDGEQWHWSGSTAPLQTVAIQFDFQSSLWVVLRTHDRQRIGLWLDEAPQDPRNWRALRRALVGSQVLTDSPLASEDRWLA